MKRRSFLIGVGGLVAGQFLLSGSSRHNVSGDFEQSDHPFSVLQDMQTGQPYRPSPDRFSLVLFMTAQQSYPSCGGAFIGVSQGIKQLDADHQIQPVIVMPRLVDQANYDDQRNLYSAQQMGFTILTGNLEDIQNAAMAMDTAFEVNNHGKANGHSLDAFFLAPNGQKLFNHYAEDRYGMMARIETLFERCAAQRRELTYCL